MLLLTVLESPSHLGGGPWPKDFNPMSSLETESSVIGTHKVIASLNEKALFYDSVLHFAGFLEIYSSQFLDIL